MADLIDRQAALDALAKQMPKTYTPDGSHPADEEIYKIQEIYVDCIESIEILPAVQPEPHWIPCSERMPKESGQYLITVKYEHVDGYEDIYAEHGDWNGEEWDMFCFGHCGKVEDIVAWMPLPEPYQGGDE